MAKLQYNEVTLMLCVLFFEIKLTHTPTHCAHCTYYDIKCMACTHASRFIEYTIYTYVRDTPVGTSQTSTRYKFADPLCYWKFLLMGYVAVYVCWFCLPRAVHYYSKRTTRPNALCVHIAYYSNYSIDIFIINEIKQKKKRQLKK